MLSLLLKLGRLTSLGWTNFPVSWKHSYQLVRYIMLQERCALARQRMLHGSVRVDILQASHWRNCIVDVVMLIDSKCL
jgi:hypothetical protein